MYDKRSLTQRASDTCFALISRSISVKSKTVAPGCLEKACYAMRDVVGSDGNARSV